MFLQAFNCQRISCQLSAISGEKNGYQFALQ